MCASNVGSSDESGGSGGGLSGATEEFGNARADKDVNGLRGCTETILRAYSCVIAKTTESI